MNQRKYHILETIFILFYFIYPFYIFYLLGSDGGIFHFNSFSQLIGTLIPSLILWCLTIVYINIRSMAPAAMIALLIVIVLFHLSIIYFLFYFFAVETYLKEKIISFIGILLTLVILFKSIFYKIQAARCS